jgi:tetratricopeptide (TPR) repeat protein
MVKKLIGISAMLLALSFGSGNQKAFADEIKNSNLEETVKSSAHKFLDIEKDCGTNESDYKTLNEIIDKSKYNISKIQKEIGVEKLPKDYSPDKVISIFESIDSTLKDLGFSYKKTDFLNEGLKSKKLDCNDYSVIYKAIGEVLGLPIFMVASPGHMFVRWDAGGEHDALNKNNPVNIGDINWETTGGFEMDDLEYASRSKIPLESLKKRGFLQNLSNERSLSLAHYEKGHYHMSKGEYKKSILDFEKSIELDPTSEFSLKNSIVLVERINYLLDKKKENW